MSSAGIALRETGGKGAAAADGMVACPGRRGRCKRDARVNRQMDGGANEGLRGFILINGREGKKMKKKGKLLLCTIDTTQHATANHTIWHGVPQPINVPHSL